MISLQELKIILDEAEVEVSRRLRRQPFPKPQFLNGVRSGVRWYMEAVAARLEQEGIEMGDAPREP